MDVYKRQLEGSPLRDRFKQLHKRLSPKNYCLDLDLVLMERHPFYGPVAILDIKRPGEGITSVEGAFYNHIMHLPEPFAIPVFIVICDCDLKNTKPSDHTFSIYNLAEIDPIPEPPTFKLKPLNHCNLGQSINVSWAYFEMFENIIRMQGETRLAKMKEFFDNMQKKDKEQTQV